MDISEIIKAKTDEELKQAIIDLKCIRESSPYYQQAHQWISEATHELELRGMLETA